MRFSIRESGRNRKRGALFASLLLVPVLSGCGPGYTPEELTEATAQVREAYYAQDYYFGVELGEAWGSKAPEAVELRAWTVANLVMILREGEPRRMAEELVAEHPDSPWSWFALAKAVGSEFPYQNEEEVMGASEKALAGLPGNPDAVILHAELVRRYEDSRDPALAFLDTTPDPVRSNLDIRAFKPFKLPPRFDEQTEAYQESVIQSYEGILAEDPDHLLANYGLGRLLKGMEGRMDRARPYLEHAAELSPSPMPHFRLWEYIVEDPDLDAEERRSEVTADLRYVLDNFPESPGRMEEMASDLGFFGFTDLEEELEERVLQDHPESWAAERVLASRISHLEYDFFNEGPTNQDWYLEQAGRLEGMVEEFVALPQHRDPSLLMDAYWTLFLLKKEKPDVDPTKLSELVETWLVYLPQVRDIWADQKSLLGAFSLAHCPQTLDAAKRLLAAGKEEMEEFVQERELQSESFSETVFDAQEAHVRSSQAYFSVVSSLVLAQEGSFEEAEETLSRALDFDPGDRDAETVLPLSDFAAGKIKEWWAEYASRKGDEATARRLLTSAEKLYLRGIRRDYYSMARYGTGWTNPNETALKDLFEQRHGGLQGFEEYLAAAEGGDLDARRGEVLATRNEDPQPILPFALRDLEGNGVTSESYLGKVVVINFWGTW